MTSGELGSTISEIRNESSFPCGEIWEIRDIHRSRAGRRNEQRKQGTTKLGQIAKKIPGIGILTLLVIGQ